jgi:hypothetical protein
MRLVICARRRPRLTTLGFFETCAGYAWQSADSERGRETKGTLVDRRQEDTDRRPRLPFANLEFFALKF